MLFSCFLQTFQVTDSDLVINHGRKVIFVKTPVRLIPALLQIIFSAFIKTDRYVYYLFFLS